MLKIGKIKSIFINEKDKDGNPLINKNNKPYKRATLQFEGDSTYYSMYLGEFSAKDQQVLATWKNGDEIEVDIEQNGNFWNFKIPNKTDLLEARVAKLEEQMKGLLNPQTNLEEYYNE